MVYVVDDDPSVRKAIGWVLMASGIETRAFKSGDEFLRALPDLEAGCLLLDINLPGISGVELLERHAESIESFPVVLITGVSEVDTAVKSMKLGAVDYLVKPFEAETLLDAISRATRRLDDELATREEIEDIRARIDSLSPREYEVFRHVVAGLLNKQIADELSISEATVKIHRGRVMAKIAVESVAELARLAERSGI